MAPPLRSIENELKKVEPLYKTRQREQTELLEELNQLSYRLGMEEDNVRPETDQLLSTEKVRVLEARRLKLDDMLQKRLRQAEKWQSDMQRFARKVGNAMDMDDENLKTILQLDLSKEDVCLSESMMSSIESYYTQLHEMYNDLVQEKEFRWTELYSRLSELWDQCHVADIERIIPESYDPDRHTERDFEEMSTEITRLECLYEARKEVCDILTKWKQKWAEKMAIEEKKKSAEYFQNRGRENNVFLDAKIERTLNEFTLPKLLKSLINAYDSYRESHPEDEIRVDGFTPPDYVKWVIDEYNASKEVERKTRRLRYDSHSNLSHCFNTTSTSSIPSMITPTKRIKNGPKHSSPKQSTPKVRSADKKNTSRRSLLKTPRFTRSPFRPKNKHT
ncbi:hypothetical protein OESDEN_10901 [Oesophagostomum dentatum]|uniref:Uncharacterized protein n=2 Tax=Oesophagostomum dentatum TaxID=61180 RepID=A0A0B1SVE6_OESDE|nr:hypothetical protein OESDEN_10901 [Oesophagostomum dentatum]